MIFAYILSKLLYIFSMQFISAYTNTHFYSFNKYLLSEGYEDKFMLIILPFTFNITMNYLLFLFFSMQFISIHSNTHY